VNEKVTSTDEGIIVNSTAWEYHSPSDHNTVGLGHRLGEILLKGDVIALTGELGSGKTCLTKGIAYGLGIPAETVITSPSYSLANEYRGRYLLVHMDLYRLEGPGEFLVSGLEEYLDGKNVVVIEWAERCPEMLPRRRLTINLSIKNEKTRIIRFSGCGPRAAEIIKALSKGGK